MGRHELEYPQEALNAIRRHGERASYALKTIHTLINTAPIVHVSFNPPGSPFPVTLPMIGQMGSYARPSADVDDPLDLYLHGYVSSRFFATARNADAGALPVCVAASHVDGLVLALSPFNHSYNYRSAVLFGHAALVDDDDEKRYAMRLITDGVVPGRWENTRQTPTAAEMQSTSILRVSIVSGSAKIRDGGVKDDKHDLNDQTLCDTVWTGVVPLYSAMAEPIPTSYNKVDLPCYAAEYLDDFNRDNKEHSVAAAYK
ncbi:hypothetical protein CDD80_3336 [Ophiocordyceps camponoti-rufipedis]|uniref:Flavin-nucleotide-binding protein n=1 Tax=Ophiocordyceps camponoti-rufipedis TaxID=2004952 RepID=A0A2C5Z3V8_9HYPO|nr:hypothetical protein CDD80_3336 [Ophiocordyceps camponoti-rufipedis]